MEFRIGRNVKPQEINQFGEVTFVSDAGVKPAAYTEEDCLDYGFNYIDSTCFSVTNEADFFTRDNTGVYNHGSKNSIFNDVYNSTIIGERNYINQFSSNNIVAGDSNTINSISNTLLNGTKGDALYNNSQVLGGNQDNDILGERQSILLLAGADTTNSTYTRAYINDDGSTLFNVEDNSIVAYTAHTIAVRTGGSSSGAKGDFKYWIERGAVVSRNGTLTLNRTRDTIASDGTHTGWNVNSDIDGTQFYVEVKGKNNIDLKWIVRIEISEMRTGINLS